MLTFFISLIILIAGYFIYGKYLEGVFGFRPNVEAPATRLYDGVDFVPMSWWRIFTIQFLNIAGLGPIFGAIAGAMFGPIVFIWIVLGCLFAGVVHDYISGMISFRNDGESIPEIVGRYLGPGFKYFMRIFTIFLLVQVGAVFVKGPAEILAILFRDSSGNETISVVTLSYIVFGYYFFATILPIDQLIGRIYPLFGAALLFMAVAVSGAILFGNFTIPELTIDTFRNMHTQAGSLPIFPILFVSVACGAISGFHSTQSPLMARCVEKEKYGRRIFAGAMIAEGIVALIWAMAGMSFFGGVEALNNTVLVDKMSYATIVNYVSETLLGRAGAILAVLGVVAAPITSGDTAFRSARLIIGDIFHFDQKPIKNRLLISAPIFAVGYWLTQIDFSIIWRYMSWSNQTLAAIVLWAITSYLMAEKKKYWFSLIPAVFMTAVCSMYILMAPEGLSLAYNTSLWISGAITLFVSFMFYRTKSKAILATEPE